ncbi:FKBP-type peptidyl-prolyl cis-trans isomerase [Candidatus Saccharibacteria bacterium]|nr:FKBP-type peptidyl-prolyl cis-trans isomerase [Candidatus Saccharibacteria bacterium]MCA9328699.1 FKBP-type peptidyl-prolyl cis-trans isomerase [Candidatus Saccharibacteria bacterium]
MLFLLSTIGATAYVIWQINQDDAPLVSEPSIEQTAQDSPDTEACGSGSIAAVEPRAVPSVTKVDGAVTELKKVDIKEGDGEEVQAGDCVAALYYGTLATNGTKFDGNYETGQPIEFSLNSVISGWTEGIPGMKVGGVRRLEIPASLAYGDQENNGIPANSDLIFEVEIVATRRGN